jgi:hypothetical protein
VKKLPLSKPIMIGVVVLVALCCGGALIVGMFTDGKTKETKQAAPLAVPSVVAPTSAPRPSPSLSPSPVPVPLKMPEVVGQNAAVAQDTLKKAGFTNVQLGSADPGDKLVILPQNWKVVEQSTPAEQTIPSDTLIVLTCTKKR